MAEEREVLLSVQHLEQFFKMGKNVNKAVNDVSFDIYKGEVFGLVGESGCGKTTTGRSIIRLYNITGGSVYFKGQRICAGLRRYKEEIARLRKEFDDERKSLSRKLSEDIAAVGNAEEKEALTAEYREKIESLKTRYDDGIAEQRRQMQEAKRDHRKCNKFYAESQAEAVEKQYSALLENAVTEERRNEILGKYKQDLRLAKRDRIMNKMQMIFQDPIASLNPRMTVREIIAEGLIIRGVRDKKFIDEQVYKVLDLVGLVPEHAGRYPHEFSGGQRQRIGIARAVILNPDLIIADEPISALDVSIQAQVINLLNDLRKNLGLTILFIAHDLSVVKYFSDRIAVMYFGKIVELASSDELFAHPLHPYTQSLLSAIPLPDPHSEKKRKRIIYNPVEKHDYSVDQPVMREVAPGHFVYCNDVEFREYEKQLHQAAEEESKLAEETVKTKRRGTSKKTEESAAKPKRTRKTKKED